ncbi:exosome complex component RRP40-like [Styela clava]
MKCPAKELDASVVMPGDIITEQVLDLIGKNERVKLGPGLRQGNDSIVVCKSGILRHKQPSMFWIDSHQKRYVPIKGENVLGVIVGKIGDAYKVDIGSSDYVVLNNLFFEGATKRNRPNLVNGDIVFGKLISANKDMEPELSCIDQSSGKANGMGPVPSNGLLITVPLNLVRKILSPDCVLLPEMGKYFGFETLIGMNGKIHLTSHSDKHIIAIMNMITTAEYMTNEQILESLSSNTADNWQTA